MTDREMKECIVKMRYGMEIGYGQEIVRCKDCRWYDLKISFCDNCHLPREQTFFCADGKRRQDDG